MSLSAPAAVQLELFTHRFAALARQMGEMLQRTAVSTNVKERLDFSCGLLDAAGELVVNAPHIPVHLGALGLCVRTVARHLTMEPGDVVVTNHPGFGGSHLPDVTVITPVFEEDVLLGYVASRAHHAELGGIRPGSMPQDAATTTFGFASSIRVASSFAANPPKTTECTAPIRAQASITTTASGTIGM